MNSGTFFSLDYSELAKPLILHVIFVLLIVYYSCKYKKIKTCAFWMCIILCFFLLSDFILYFFISRGYIITTSIFFKTNYFYSIADVLSFLLVIQVMIYYQWHIAEKFRDDWGPKKQYYAKIISQTLAIIMILIHFIMYIDVYFQLNY